MWDDASHWSGGSTPAPSDSAWLVGDASSDRIIIGPSSDESAEALIIGSGDPAIQTTTTLQLSTGGITAERGVSIREDGLLTGAGQTTGDLYNDGTLAPGVGAGELSILGDYTQTGALEIELLGITPTSEHDTLTATGVLQFREGSTLSVELPSLFSPQPGDSFLVATGSEVFADDLSIMLPSGLAMTTELSPSVVQLANGRQGLLLETTLIGVFNGDGVVGVEDFSVWKSTYGSRTELAADGNGDGVVDAQDYAVWRNQFMGTAPLSGVSVPEPCALFLALFAVVAGQPRLRGHRPSECIVSCGWERQQTW